MTTHGNISNDAVPERRMDASVCRRTGCGEPPTCTEGFCSGCKRAYEAIRLVREQTLADAARLLGLANPQWRDAFAEALPGQYELLLLHAVAHHLHRKEVLGEGLSLAALHDYLDDTMDRISDAAWDWLS
jgi:hypothetical protein